MSDWDFGGPPPAGHTGQYDEYGEFVYADSGDAEEYADDFEGGAFTPISYERDPYEAPPPLPPRRPRPPWPDLAPDDQPLEDRQLGHRQPDDQTRVFPDRAWPPRVAPRPRRLRWLAVGAVIAAAAAMGGVTTVVLAGGPARSPAPPVTSLPPVTTAPPAPAPAPAQPLSMAQARQVFGAYTTANNRANARMSNALLGTIETGSSLAIDAGLYRVQRAEKAAPYPAFSAQQARFYIPQEPSAVYPHWFVVQAVNANLADPKKATGTEYVLFTQETPGAPWRNAIEPYVLGGAVMPHVRLSADGLAIPVGLDDGTLAIPPTAIAQQTAAWLDGAKGGPATPGNLADGLDKKFWHKSLPAATVLDRHLPTAQQVFGLRTRNGGALLFYTDSAVLTLIPPAGDAMHLTIPGFFSPSQALNAAEIGYMDQFAAYVPPRGGSALRIVADYSGITTRY